ncbi:uncharacterized protein FPRO_05590 [Fusarium proliferatum ET1]|uniref:BZIP domain-containing protein n=1 Tax=Fusarium proliferatum (strain ET1) TaxID=1227346 RepID=A0A1L7VEZ2_FUSPR|nr:uncharacterized protein FPRO_05590 [Fusarium proliferatum ET1]CZR39218.1 uncharacterized protein FPRO_05590 [Fusarium proliferatum ET1]
MEQAPTTHENQSYDLSLFGNLDAATQFLGDQWYLASNGGNYQCLLPGTGDYIPGVPGDPALVQWPEPLLSPELPTPQQDSSSAIIASPASNAECRPDSLVHQHASQCTAVSTSSSDVDHHISVSTQTETQKRSVSFSVDSTMTLSQGDTTTSPNTEISVQEAGPSTKRRATTSTVPTRDVEYIKKVRERNKRAATKVRLKQRETEKNLASAEKEMQQTNQRLTECVKELTNQVHDLKMQLLQHGTCDCVLIQEYIGNEANRYVQETSG